jgi:hypothetical protein
MSQVIHAFYILLRAPPKPTVQRVVAIRHIPAPSPGLSPSSASASTSTTPFLLALDARARGPSSSKSAVSGVTPFSDDHAVETAQVGASSASLAEEEKRVEGGQAVMTTSAPESAPEEGHWTQAQAEAYEQAAEAGKRKAA